MFFRAALIVILAVAGFAKEKPAPLPDKIVAAKSAFLDNKSGIADIGDKAFNALSKWGRFKLVKADQSPDLIIRFSVEQFDDGSTISGTVRPQYGTDSSDVRLRENKSVARFTVLQVIDPATGLALWENRLRWGGGSVRAVMPVLAMFPPSATKALIKDLQSRLNEEKK